MLDKYYLKGVTTTDQVECKISEKDWNRVRNSKKLIDQLSYIEQKYDLVISNYLSFEKELLEHTLNFEIRRGKDHISEMVELSTIVREALNLIISISSFYEQTEKRHLKSLEQLNEKLNSLIERFRDLRQLHIELQFIINLRNYSAHRDIPIHSVTLGESAWERGNTKEDDRLAHSIVPYISLDRLYKDRKFNKSVLAKISTDNHDNVDIRYPIRKSIGLLSNFIVELREQLWNDVESAKSIFKEFIDKFQNTVNSTADFCKVYHEKDGQIIKEYFLDFDQFKSIEFYSNRNPGQGLLEKRYIHNRIKTSS